MSEDYKGANPLDLAKEAERDLNSGSAKKGIGGYVATHGSGHGKGASDSTLESGVDDSVQSKFPGADVIYGSAASGAGNNREIPVSEGGGINPKTGQPYKARDFEGTGGPEDKDRIYAEENPGSDKVRGNVR